MEFYRIGSGCLLKDLGIQCIKLDLPFRLNHVNCFLAEGENGWKVIDTGLHQKDTVNRWENELMGKTVTDIIITHYHPDHFGYAGGLQKQTGARVSMTEMDANAAEQAWQQDFIDQFYQYYEWAGIPEGLTEQIIHNTRAFIPVVTPYPEVHHYLEEGEV